MTSETHLADQGMARRQPEAPPEDGLTSAGQPAGGPSGEASTGEAPAAGGASGGTAADGAAAGGAATDGVAAGPARGLVPATRRPADDQPAAAGTARRGRRRRPPVLVLVITALHIAFLATYSFVYPTWTGYDEAQHVDMVYGLQHGAGWPGPGEKMIAVGVAATSDDFDRGRYQDMFQSGGKRRGSEPFAEIDPTPRGERQSFDELGGPTPIDDGRLSNQMIQHPPMVYAVGAALLTVLPGSADWAYDRQVYALRLLNIAILAPLPLLAWAAARRFGLSDPLATAAAALPLAVPGFTRVGATFNNDGILVLTTGALTVVLAGVMRGDLRRRTAAWAGLWFGLALLSKAFALALPVVICAAYLVGWLRVRRDAGRPPRLPWVPAALAVGLGLAIGGWWWARNYILYDAVQPNGWATNPPRREPLLLPDSFFTWFWYFFRTMISRFWGGLGMFEPPQLSPVAIVAATVVVVGLCAAAVIHGARRGFRAAESVPAPGAAAGSAETTEAAEAAPAAGSAKAAGSAETTGPAGTPGRLVAAAAPLVLLLPIFLAYLMVGQRSWAEYERYTRGIAVQGRYLYLGLVGLAVVVALGLGRALAGRLRWAPPVMLAGALVMQGAALLAVCTYYWLPRGVSFTPARIPDAAAAIARWAPFPVGVTYTVFVVAAAGAVVTLALAVRAAVRGARAAAADAPAAPAEPEEAARVPASLG